MDDADPDDRHKTNSRFTQKRSLAKMDVNNFAGSGKCVATLSARPPELADMVDSIG
jgi:hypothetical protein